MHISRAMPPCRLTGNTETGRHPAFPKISRVTPCLGTSYDTVKFITAWQVILKQAATRPKNPSTWYG